MRIDTTRRLVLGLWAVIVWAIAGAILTREVLATSRAADVISASPLCPPACPVDAAPSWLALTVMAGWVLVAVASGTGLAVVVGRQLLGADDA